MKDTLDIWDEANIENLPFYGSANDLNNLSLVVARCLENISASTSPRAIVLETWLAVDFTVRQFLLAGFGLVRFCDEDFDVRYRLLPSSFSGLLKLFKDVVEYNSKFSLEPDPPRPDKTGGFRASHQFWSFIKDKHKPLLDKIQEVQREYIREMNPEPTEEERIAYYATVSPISLDGPKTNIEKMNLEWRKVASKLNKPWFKSAEQLNKARNIAAHNVDADKIGLKLGISVNSGNKTNRIRKKCSSLLSTLLAVNINRKEKDN